MKRTLLCAFVFIAAFGLAAWSQEQTAGTPQKPTIKKVTLKSTSPASGEEMYMAYCAACHGKTAKGDGPAAPALKQLPPDLTVLAKNNNGKFPASRVSRAVQFGTEIPAHGTKDMPIWGPLFSSLHGQTTRNDAFVQMRVVNLTKYIESLQAK